MVYSPDLHIARREGMKYKISKVLLTIILTLQSIVIEGAFRLPIIGVKSSKIVMEGRILRHLLKMI